MNIEERARRIVVDHLGCTADNVTRDATLIDDLGADSLDVVELVMAFEEAFGVEIPDEEADKLHTFGDAVDFITSHQS